MHTEITKMYLNDIELDEISAGRLFRKYILDYMTLEAFRGGIEIEIPEGRFRADVKIVHD